MCLLLCFLSSQRKISEQAMAIAANPLGSHATVLLVS